MEYTKKHLKAVISDRPQYKRLINAVINDIGLESIQDVMNNGASAGFGSFIYYSDTLAFFKRYRKEILSLLDEIAYDLGKNRISLIQSFNCLTTENKNYKPYSDDPRRVPHYTEDEIARAIYQGKGESSTQILNALAWFALEEVCRMFDSVEVEA